MRLYRDSTMTEAEVIDFCQGVAVVYSNRSPDKQTPNEDTAAVIPAGPDAGVLAIADGMGGGRGGELAASAAVESLGSTVGDAATDGTLLRAAILDGFETANQRVQELNIGAATTLAVVEIQGREVRPYHVGDSTILVVGQRGKIKLQTISHSPVGFAVEAGVLDESEAMHHEDRHIVSNVVGCPEMRIEIGSPICLAPRDTVLLGSDGLFDNLHLEEIIERIRKGPVDQAVARLVDLAHARMTGQQDVPTLKPDDLTMVAWRQTWGDVGSSQG